MQETPNLSVSRFSQAFLRRTTKPRFKYIAPGLTVYDTAALPPEIAIHHPNWGVPVLCIPYYREFNGIPAVSDTVAPFPAAGVRYLERQVGSWVYSDPAWADTVKLALPFELASYPRYDGQYIPRKTLTAL